MIERSDILINFFFFFLFTSSATVGSKYTIQLFIVAKKNLETHTRLEMIFDLLVGKIATGGFLHPPLLMLLQQEMQDMWKNKQ